MSREQANTFKKHRDAEDPQGNLTWIMRLHQKGLRAGAEALARLDIERDFELTDDEKVLWRLIKLPRKVLDLEQSGILTIEKTRGFLRGLVAADVVDIVEGAEAKALIPAEVRRVKGEVTGAPAAKKTEPLRAKVYRPDISKPGDAPPNGGGAQAPAQPAPEPFQAPARSNPTNPAVAAPRTLSGEQRSLKEHFESAFDAMKKQNHYEFMGLARPTDDASVKQAFVRLAREYHPDKLAGSGLAGEPGLQVKVDALFKRLGDANQALANAEARAAYDRTLDTLNHTPAHGVPSGKVRRPAEALNAFKMGDTFFKKRDFKQAEMHLRQAAMFDPEDPKILTALAWCIYSNPEHEEGVRVPEARKRLLEVTQKFKLGDAHYKLGLLLRKSGDEGGAQRQFGTAAKLDPNHTDAVREVRLLEMRAAKEDKDDKGGLLGKLLRK